jgi:hypothetical protein
MCSSRALTTRAGRTAARPQCAPFPGGARTQRVLDFAKQACVETGHDPACRYLAERGLEFDMNAAYDRARGYNDAADAQAERLDRFEERQAGREDEAGRARREAEAAERERSDRESAASRSDRGTAEQAPAGASSDPGAPTFCDCSPKAIIIRGCEKTCANARGRSDQDATGRSFFGVRRSKSKRLHPRWARRRLT